MMGETQEALRMSGVPAGGVGARGCMYYEFCAFVLVLKSPPQASEGLERLEYDPVGLILSAVLLSHPHFRRRCGHYATSSNFTTRDI
jgi:hypothetical protein